MPYLAERTSIPAPKVYYFVRRKGVTYIAMERVKEKCLLRAGTNALFDRKRRYWVAFRRFFRRCAVSLYQMIRSAISDGGSLWACRLPSSLRRYGSFETTGDIP